MFCPNCGNKNSESQKFCRTCGLGLEKAAQSLAEQLPTREVKNLQQRTEKLERLGVAALSVFGLGILSVLLYLIFYKLMLTQGKIIAGLLSFAGLIVAACGLLSVYLFAKANELKEASGKRRLEEGAGLNGTGASTGKLPEPVPQPAFPITEGTTELLTVDKRDQR